MKNNVFKSLPHPNVLVDLIEVIHNIQVNDNSGCIWLSTKVASDLGEKKTNEILNHYHPDYDLFKDIFDEIKGELLFIAGKLDQFLHTKSDQSISAIENYNTLFNFLIRVYRLGEIVRPDYSVSITKNTKIQKLYETAKGFWITDNGTRERVFNKNFGQRSNDFEDYVSKLLTHLGFEVTPAPKKYEGIKFDFLVSKENKNYFCEVKIKETDQFFDTFMTIEMWQHYKKIYGV
jgi:hypothetical protein